MLNVGTADSWVGHSGKALPHPLPPGTRKLEPWILVDRVKLAESAAKLAPEFKTDIDAARRPERDTKTHDALDRGKWYAIQKKWFAVAPKGAGSAGKPALIRDISSRNQVVMVTRGGAVTGAVGAGCVESAKKKWGPVLWAVIHGRPHVYAAMLRAGVTLADAAKQEKELLYGMLILIPCLDCRKAMQAIFDETPWEEALASPEAYLAMGVNWHNLVNCSPGGVYPDRPMMTVEEGKKRWWFS